MKKSLLSMIACVCAMRLAIAVGAEESIRDWVNMLEEAALSRRPEAVAADAGVETGEVGEVDLISVVFYGESGETALNLGENAQAEVVETGYFGPLSIRNDSTQEVDIDALLAEGPGLSLSNEGPQVLIIHTHGSEAYSQAPGELYEESDPYRTEDRTKNVVKVGDVLTEVLESKGLSVIHDREIYDHPSYTGSYSRSGGAVEAYLAEYPSIGVVIDLHRDALGSGDTVYKTMAEASLGECAQVMLLVGTGENGLYHPLWRQNLRLALYLQNAMEKEYPGLARPLSLKSERYNQHLSPGSMIIEVGSTGNTLSEAIRAIELFGDAAGDALIKLLEEE